MEEAFPAYSGEAFCYKESLHDHDILLSNKTWRFSLVRLKSHGIRCVADHQIPISQFPSYIAYEKWEAMLFKFECCTCRCDSASFWYEYRKKHHRRNFFFLPVDSSILNIKQFMKSISFAGSYLNFFIILTIFALIVNEALRIESVFGYFVFVVSLLPSSTRLGRLNRIYFAHAIEYSYNPRKYVQLIA